MNNIRPGIIMPVKANEWNPANQKSRKSLPDDSIKTHKTPLLARRRAKFKTQANQLKLNTTRSVNHEVEEIKSEVAKLQVLDDENNKITIDRDRNRGHTLYPIDSNGVKLYAHQILEDESDLIPFWSLIESKDIKKIISLQDSRAYASNKYYGT